MSNGSSIDLISQRGDLWWSQRHGLTRRSHDQSIIHRIVATEIHRVALIGKNFASLRAA